jgi:hypothetical protein
MKGDRISYQSTTLSQHIVVLRNRTFQSEVSYTGPPLLLPLLGVVVQLGAKGRPIVKMSNQLRGVGHRGQLYISTDDGHLFPPFF